MRAQANQNDINAGTVVVTTDSEEKTKKPSTLENLAELLVAFYNGASSSDVSNMARFATSATIPTELLFLNNVMRTLCYAVTGLMLFGGAFVYHLCAGTVQEHGPKKLFESIFSGRNRDILLSCFCMLIGGILQSTQTNRAAAEKNTVIVGFGYLFIIFAGYLTGGGSLKHAAQSFSQVTQSRDPVLNATVLEQSITTLPANKKDNLENYLRLILSFRNAAIAAGGTGLGYSVTANVVEVDKLLLNYAMIHFFYGVFCGLFTYASLFYDACCTNRSQRLGCVDTFDGHFSGIKLQIVLSGKASFAGALILLIQSMTTKSPVALAMAEWFLGISGFLTGSKVTSVFERMKRAVSRVEEVPDSMVEPIAVSHPFPSFAAPTAAAVAAGSALTDESDDDVQSGRSRRSDGRAFRTSILSMDSQTSIVEPPSSPVLSSNEPFEQRSAAAAAPESASMIRSISPVRVAGDVNHQPASCEVRARWERAEQSLAAMARP